MDIKQVAHTYANNAEFKQEAEEKYRELLSRSATDPQFRQQLLTNPRAAISEFSGHEAAPDFNVVFIENTADATIVLPDPVDSEAELSEQDLEAVAGGITPILGIIASVLWISAETVAGHKQTLW